MALLHISINQNFSRHSSPEAGSRSRITGSVASHLVKIKCHFSSFSSTPICDNFFPSSPEVFYCIFAGAGSSRQRRWVDVRAGDIRVVFAYCMAMGVVHKSNVTKYWASEFWLATPFFNEYMSLNNFQLIMSNLHFCNDLLNPLPRTPGHDPLAKIRNIVSVLQRTFREAYTPRREIGLDEATCKFHGVCKFRCFNPNKPDKYHLKLYAVAESLTGYIIGFEVYTGKTAPTTKTLMATRFDVPRDCRLRFDPFNPGDNERCTEVTGTVMQMLHKYDLLDQGYHLYTDNYYTSVDLARMLIARDTMLVGTVRTNRVGWPVGLKNAVKNSVKNHPVIKKRSEDTAWRRSTDGQVMALCHGDRKVFSLLSTIHVAKRKQVFLRAENKWGWKPTAVIDYNHGMKAVDLSDQILKSYEMNRKTLLWTNKLVFHMVNMVCVNAYQLYKAAKLGKLTHEQFRGQIIQDLVESGNEDRAYPRPNRRVAVEAPDVKYNERHFPEEIPVRPGARKHRKCGSCYSKPAKNTTVRCRPCQKFLCAWPCFKVWHTKDLSHERELAEHRARCAQIPVHPRPGSPPPQLNNTF